MMKVIHSTTQKKEENYSNLVRILLLFSIFILFLFFINSSNQKILSIDSNMTIWNTRYFILTNNCLYYFLKENVLYLLFILLIFLKIKLDI